MSRPGFVFDVDRCLGCHACVLACANQNGLAPGSEWRQVHDFNRRHHPGAPVLHLSLACQHCRQPACLRHCPARAYRRDEASGAVVLDESKCIGCTYCTWACPFAAPRFSTASRTVRKCDFCRERRRSGHRPACVEMCPVGALEIGDIGDDEPLAAPPGFPPSRLEPAVSFVHAARALAAPESTAPPPPALLSAMHEPRREWPPPQITLRGEWTLLLFTFSASALVGVTLGEALGGPAVPPLLLLGGAGATLLVSLLHLGRRRRAWRALSNWRTSWLSREVLFFILFMAGSAARLFVSPGRPALLAATSGAGLLALFSVDRLYQVALHAGPAHFHSAHTLLNGLFLAGVMAGRPLLALPLALLKMALYAWRMAARRKACRPLRPLIGLLRLTVGIVLPLGLLDRAPGAAWPLAAGCAVLLGDFIDRCEYYTEMELVTPRRQMVLDLEARLRGGAEEMRPCQ